MAATKKGSSKTNTKKDSKTSKPSKPSTKTKSTREGWLQQQEFLKKSKSVNFSLSSNPITFIDTKGNEHVFYSNVSLDKKIYLNEDEYTHIAWNKKENNVISGKIKKFGDKFGSL